MGVVTLAVVIHGTDSLSSYCSIAGKYPGEISRGIF